MVVVGSVLLDCVLGLLIVNHAIDQSNIETYQANVGYVLGSGFKRFMDFA